MPEYVAFLRAVNVGGRFVKMAELRECLSAGGFSDVETYIQSGNVRLAVDAGPVEVAADVERLLGERFGIVIPAVLRTPSELTALVAAVDAVSSPLPGEPRRYVSFLTQPPAPDAAAALDAWDRPGERARALGRDVLLWLTIGAHEAKLTNARLERLVSGVATTRDLKVVRAVADRWGD